MGVGVINHLSVCLCAFVAAYVFLCMREESPVLCLFVFYPWLIVRMPI